jgi:hypothetical protein
MVWLLMGPGTFIIAILGCGEADAACTQVRVLETRYESEAACSRATDAVLPAHSDVDFPVVVAQCVAAGGAPQSLRANQVKLPDGGSVEVRVSPLRGRS